MKPPPLGYWAPASLAEALALLDGKPNARVLAGGQSLMPMLNMRLASPEHLVDLNRVRELAYIRGVGAAVEIGSMTRQRDIERSELVAQALPLMAEAIRRVGHRQTRNRGTIGGSLCHLDPSAELPAVAMAMDATLSVVGRRGTRVLPMTEFAAGLMTAGIEPGEILTQIRIERWDPGHGSAFVEFARRHGDFAVAGAAALVALRADGAIARVSLTLGGVCAVPLRMRRAEQMLEGSRPESAPIDEACAVGEDLQALEDPAYPAWYRRRLAAALSRRALALALSRARRP